MYNIFEDNIDYKSQINLDLAVDKCPHCGTTIDPIYICHHQDYTEVPNDQIINNYYVICRCSATKCNGIFYVQYTTEGIPGGYDNNGNVIYSPNLLSSNTYPPALANLKFDSIIENISPLFVEVYTEALTAETQDLNNICGPGYRLALEIIVKDFVCYLQPNKTEEIKSDPKLSNVISNRIPDKPIFDDLKGIASRAWWLGNDYSHYVKKYKNQDVSDLKNCIDITINEISYYLKREQYMEDITKD